MDVSGKKFGARVASAVGKAGAAIPHATIKERLTASAAGALAGTPQGRQVMHAIQTILETYATSKAAASTAHEFRATPEGHATVDSIVASAQKETAAAVGGFASTAISNLSTRDFAQLALTLVGHDVRGAGLLTDYLYAGAPKPESSPETAAETDAAAVSA